MKRKLIKQAGQAITITLPIQWIRDNDLKPGDEIDIDIIEKEVRLRTQNKVSTGSAKINLQDLPKRLRYNYINSAYARGIDTLEIDADDFLPNLYQSIGYAIVSQKGSKKTIKDIGGVSTENLDEIFKRVFQSILMFHDNAIEDIFGESKATNESINKIDQEINKLALFLQRSIMKHVHPSRSKGKIMFAYSYALEQLGDEVLRLWRTSIEGKIKKTKEVKEIVSLSKQALQKAFEIYYQFNDKKIKELLVIKDSIRKKADAVMGCDKATSKLAMYAVKIAEDCADLTQLSIMSKIKS